MVIGVYICIHKLVYACKGVEGQAFFIAVEVVVYTGPYTEAVIGLMLLMLLLITCGYGYRYIHRHTLRGSSVNTCVFPMAVGYVFE